MSNMAVSINNLRSVDLLTNIITSLKRDNKTKRRQLKQNEGRTMSDKDDRNQIGLVKTKCFGVADWNFDVFTFNKMTEGRALLHISLNLFQEHGFIEFFHLDTAKLVKFISLVEEGYHNSNPYHNAVHAADVTQAMHCYLRERKLDKALSPLEKMTAIIAAMTHDLDHPGVNQSFLIATSHHLATLYNNCSVLENHHWKMALGLLHKSGLFESFDNSLWKTIEWQLKSMILATDISRQNEFLQEFRTQNARINFNLDDSKQRNFILQIALKCADVSNPSRTWKTSKQWSDLICNEFFRQGDRERQLDLPVTPCCDRLTTSISKIQIGFINFVAMPLLTEWHEFSQSSLSQLIVSNVKTNLRKWEELLVKSKTDKLEQNHASEREE